MNGYAWYLGKIASNTGGGIEMGRCWTGSQKSACFVEK